MLSQKTRYAIRAMQHLADRHGAGPVQLAEIAEAQKIPANFLTVILSELSRVGLVASMRGKDGGYWLALSPIDITYGDLIRVMRGSLALVRAARAQAVLSGRDFVTPDDVREVAKPALRHRIALAPELQIEGQGADDVLHALLAKVDAPRQ